MRDAVFVCLAVVFLTVAGGSLGAEEAPARETVAAVKTLDVPGALIAVAAGRDAREFLFVANDGVVHRYRMGEGIVWKAPGTVGKVSAVVASPKTDDVLVQGAGGLVLLDASSKAPRWTAASVVTAAFAPDGESVWTVSADGTAAKLSVATGKQMSASKLGTRRSVVRASLHPQAGLAVLGVADG